ncbi:MULTISPECIES: hypothetical protein [unclassified Rhodococcus (in: high G+C Gram-positive bacteria)]|nr:MULTISPECIES: hypothetical protein [unclassified Rhodococcus (in: high G+C Gram-positive bacteria)]
MNTNVALLLLLLAGGIGGTAAVRSVLTPPTGRRRGRAVPFHHDG